MNIFSSSGEVRLNGRWGNDQGFASLWFGGSAITPDWGNHFAFAVNFTAGIPDTFIGIHMYGINSPASGGDARYAQYSVYWGFGLTGGGTSQSPNNNNNNYYTGNTDNSPGWYGSFEGGSRRWACYVQAQDYGRNLRYITKVVSRYMNYITISVR
jgi:hypothetical protein